jgi:ATP-dependent DNA helicase RecG
MTAAQLLELIAQGESASVEFKSSFQKDAIETLTAFANTKGGSVILGVNDARQISIGEYPMDALREIIINMIVHRDYRSANDSTIKVFDNRIEFFNPGALLDDLTVEKIKTGHYKSHLRNKQIATIFRELELIEKYGSGVRRVIDTFTAYGLPEPEFEATQGGMAVTVFKIAEKTTDVGANVGADVGVNVGVKGLLDYVQTNPGQRASEMAVFFAVTQRTIERWLKQLKAQGQVEFRGATKTGGYHATAPKEGTQP